MASLSTPRPDEAVNLAEDAAKKSPVRFHRARTVYPDWLKRELKHGPQPGAADTFGDVRGRGVDGLKRMIDDMLWPDKNGPTGNIHETEETPLQRLTDDTQEQLMKTKAVRRRKAGVGDVFLAMHDFVARSADELNVAKGDKVEVIDIDDDFGAGWRFGRNLGDGKCGLFPEAYAGVKVSEGLGASNDQPTTDEEDPEAQGLDTDSDPGPDIVEVKVASRALGPVCGRCGARWDPDMGCSGSCGGPQDDLSDEESVDRYPKKGKTRIPAHLISEHVVQDLGYPYRKEGNTVVVLRALSQQHIDELLQFSEERKRSKLEMDTAGSYSGSQTGDKILLPSSNRPTCSTTSSHDDHESHGIVQTCDNSSTDGDRVSNYGDENPIEDEVVDTEERTSLRGVHAGSQPQLQSSKEGHGSNTTYSAVFSENSRPQPTDPSSWFESSPVDRAGSRGHPADLATASPTKDNHDESQGVEDCNQSISSVADSIGSAVSTGGFLGQAGVNYVVAKFTQSDPELLALYTEASQRLTKDRFVDNNRRLLKMFYLDFADEEQTTSQKEALAFLRSRRRRAEISSDIFRAVTPDNEINNLAGRERNEFSMLNAYFETLDAADTGKNVEKDEIWIDSDGSEVEDGTDPPVLDMTSLQAIGEYFVTSRAFSQYKQRLYRFLHPDQKKEHESTEGQGTKCKPENDHGDESRETERGNEALPSAVTEHPLDNHVAGTGIQVDEEEYPAEQQSRSGNSRQPLPQPIPTPDHLMPWQRDSLAIWVTKLVTDTFWPPLKGSQRIWYLCGCGEHSYVDVKELEYGGIETEWRSISESAAAVRRARTPSENAPSGGQLPEAPLPVHLDRISPVRTAPQNLPTQATSHTPEAYLYPTTATSPSIQARNTPQDPLFLLICMNGKSYKTLAELKCLGLDDSYNDELMVKGILGLYDQARKGHQWTADLLLPTWVVPASVIRHLKNVWKFVAAPVRKLSFIQDLSLVKSISKWWSESAFNVSPWAPLHIIDTADFVEFELVPHPEGKEAFPSHFTSGCWPPDTKQYRYRPVPMKCVKTMNLWHMRRPGPHTEVYWYNTVPKKVDGPLYRPSGTVDEVVGYGVRINERLNDVLILWWSFIFILVTGVFVYVYSHCTGDDSSAFGLGAYLVAAFTVYIQLQYAWWKRA